MSGIQTQSFGRVPSGSDYYAVDGLRPETLLRPGDTRELGSFLACLSGQSLATVPWGGGTRMTLGNPLDGWTPWWT